MKKSSFGSLDIADAIKGAIMAAIAALLSAVLVILQDGNFPTTSEFKSIGIIGLTAGVGYLVKNFFTNSDDKFASTENKEVV